MKYDARFYDMTKMKTRHVTVTRPTQFLIKVGKSCDHTDEIENVSHLTLCLDDFDLDLSEFVNGKKKSIADILMQNHSQSLEREVEKEEQEFARANEQEWNQNRYS